MDGAWCHAGSSAGSSSRRAAFTRFRDFIKRGPGFYRTYRAKRMKERQS